MTARRGLRALPFQFGWRKPMIGWQSSGHFSREKGRVSVRHERYFLTISQQKPGKRYFCEKKFLNRLAPGPPFLTQRHSVAKPQPKPLKTLKS
jgi:hypothetical protein